MSALDERRQRAREAFDVEFGGHDILTADALDVAIDTATRVRITDEAVALAVGATPRGFTVSPELSASIRGNLADALRELGFEVEQ